MINNRQNGRRRGRGGNGNGGGQRGGNPGRPDSGNRIDSRARGNANQLFEKYRNLARDAQMSGDRVNTEYYLQFADHYFRVLSESRSRSEEQQAPRRQSNDSFDAFDDAEEYGDEGEPIRANEQGGDANRGQRNGGRDHGGEGRDGFGGQDQARDGDRHGHQSGERQTSDRGADDRGQNDGRQGDHRSAEDRARGPREGRHAARRNGGDEGAPVEAVSAEAQTIANDVDGAAEPVTPEPRRTRRPRRERTDVAAPTDAAMAIEADRLPPSLTIAADEPAAAPAVEGEAADQPKPRRRRLRAANGGDVAPAE